MISFLSFKIIQHIVHFRRYVVCPSSCYPPVLNSRGPQKHKFPLNDVIRMRQPLLPVLQGQFGFGQVMTSLLVFRL